KLLKDLKELAEYDQSTSTDRPIFLIDNKDHRLQNKESPENSSEENVVSKTNQEPPQDLDIHQLIEECFIEVPEEQKQNVEKTIDPKNSLSMGYEHISITPEIKYDEVTESNAKNLLPIPSECEVTLEDKRECDELICENSSIIDVCDNHSEILFDSNNDDLSSDDESFKDIEYVDAPVPDPAIVSVEEENVVQREEENVDLEEISQVQDVVLREKLFSITCLISNIESLNDNSTPDCVFNYFESDNSLLDNYSLKFETFCDHSEETRVERLINLVKNDNYDNSSNDPLLEEVDLFLSDNSIPPDIENVADDPEGDILMEDIVEPDEHFNPGGEILVSTNNENVDYFPFMFVIRIFLPYLILPEISPLFLSAESGDTIFDPGISE
nr:hypothetical protein [Tanacetum cinerariifolium]